MKGHGAVAPPVAHGRQTIDPRPARKAHDEGLGEVVLGMAKRDIGDPVRPCPVGQQRVAGATRAVGQIARPVPAPPFERVMRNGQPGTDPRDPGRLIRRLGRSP